MSAIIRRIVTLARRGGVIQRLLASSMFCLLVNCPLLTMSRQTTSLVGLILCCLVMASRQCPCVASGTEIEAEVVDHFERGRIPYNTCAKCLGQGHWKAECLVESYSVDQSGFADLLNSRMEASPSQRGTKGHLMPVTSSYYAEKACPKRI